MTFASRIVRKIWLDGQALPCGGEVDFELARPLESPDLSVVMPTLITVDVVGGLMTWAALVSDGEEPIGTVYRVTPRLLDATGKPIMPTGLSIRTYLVAVPFGTEDMELPAPTVQTDRYVGVVGPAGAGVMFLDPGEEVPPGHPEHLLIARPAS